MTRKSQPAVLTIAGSDCSGGAGIQADLKTFAAHGCYGMSVITALTAQNTTGVQDVFPVPPGFVEEQIKSVLDDIEVGAIKTGMLYDADNAKAVVKALSGHFAGMGIPALVCDPVCVSTSGHTLLHPDAVEVVIKELFPLAALVTPNKSEAELLLRYSERKVETEITSLETMLDAAGELLTLGSQAVLLKGGHVTVTLADLASFSDQHSDVRVIRDGLLGENMEILQVEKSSSASDRVVVDVLREKTGDTTVLARPHISTRSTHGTGCTLSAAIASELARGTSMAQAVRAASVYTHLGIEDAPGLGHGNGPLNHLHSLRMACVPAKSPSNPYPLTKMLIESTTAAWKHFVEHEFVRLLGQGVLPAKCFAYFIKQDYIYLKYYARAHGLLAAKSTSYPEIASATQIILNILTEIDTHKTMSAEFGISIEDLENAEEGIETTGYGGYLLTMGLEGDATKLLMAVLACLLGYGEAGLWLKKQATVKGSGIVLEGNPFRRWIEDYSGEAYQEAIRVGLERIEACAEADPPSPARLKDWLNVWKRCTELEAGFWDAAMKFGS